MRKTLVSLASLIFCGSTGALLAANGSPASHGSAAAAQYEFPSCREARAAHQNRMIAIRGSIQENHKRGVIDGNEAGQARRDLAALDKRQKELFVAGQCRLIVSPND